MKNKILLTITLILLPITIISFSTNETNFFTEEKKENQITIEIQRDNEQFSIPLEEYLIGVLAAEMPASFHEEALKAQAVAARTYAIKKLKDNIILTGTTADQAYITKQEMQEKWQTDYELYYNKIKSSVEATKNEVIYYENQLINAYYFSMSNGQTENSQTVFQETSPYLQSVESKWEETARNYTTTTLLTEKELCTLLSLNCQTISLSSPIYSQTHRLEKITINNTTFTGLELREKLALRSTDITFAKTKDGYSITTKGYGHGVGMSQYGANGMAKEGANYQEILKYYYQNVEIKNYQV